MRILYDDVSAITMTNEDSSFPVENSRTEFQGQLSKATGQTSTLDISVDNRGNALFIGNTNAESMVVRIYDYLDVLQSTETVYFDYQDTIQYNMTGESKEGFIENFHTFTYLPDEYRVEVDLTTTASILEFGTVRSGFADHWASPSYGWQMGIVDTSIFNRTNAGSRFVNNRDKYRAWNGSFLSLEHGQYMKWMDFFYKNENLNVAFDFWDASNTRQIGFGSISQAPGFNFQNPGSSNISINVEETL